MSASGILSRKIKRYYRRVDDPAYANDGIANGQDALDALRREDPELDRILSAGGNPRRRSIAEVTGLYAGLTDEQKRRVLSRGEG